MNRKNPFDDAEPEIRELARFSSEFNRESDRGAVLIAGSRLDEVLKAILLAFFRKTTTAEDLLEGFNAPLGTFSSRASACHALGLIEDNEFREITLIRKIRNEFGHKWKDISFDSQRIKDLTLRLPWLGPAEHKKGSTPRARFNFAVVILLTDLLWRERLVMREKIGARMWRSKMRDNSRAEPDGAANGSQPIRSERNRTSSAAGSRR
ncbi:MAG: transcriptional regulator [Verrucomicrobia bacterium]|nr:transcriptional regulator [Verrucomicrobiota bacterium]